jgi:hypothetical protein
MLGPSAPVALMPMKSLAQLEQETSNANRRKQSTRVIQSLAAHVRKRWEIAKDGRADVELRMTDNIRRRRGEYDADKLREIREQGGSEIFLGVTSTKCRAAAAWLRETLMGTGLDRPWQLEPTPEPELPPEILQQLHVALQQEVMQAYTSGLPVDPEALRQTARSMREDAANQVREEAKKRVERMSTKIEDQLVEGYWVDAFGDFIDDLVTFPTAILKGPVPRQRKRMEWTRSGLEPVEVLHLEWERVDPFMFYPAPWASDVDDGFGIERHRLTREDLQAMIGVEGYDDDAIKSVLGDFDAGGLREWLWIDSAKAEAEGKSDEAHRPPELIDALQLWDSVEGRMLIEWGVPEEEIEDPWKSYPCEVWLIGGTVIRAVLNYDPLGRKPYYTTSYERIPGAFWGNSVVDLVRDPQDMANACARALANNMGIASGPQVTVNVSRLARGEDITQMYPWKIWQTAYNDFTDPSKPIEFFQPSSNAAELLTVLEKFASLADEYSGIPKYMTGEHVAGAGRTSSGLSMLINNAAKSLKHVVSNVDNDVIRPMLERIYQHNLRYSNDPDLVGDVRIVARGAMSLVSREAAAVRRNEFLQIVLGSQLAQQIVGMPGAAELLRENARLLDVNVDRLVPSREALERQMMQQAVMQQAMLAQGQQPGQQEMLGAPTQPDGSREGGRDSNNVSPRPNNR